jgi:hypothetical protein
MLSQTQFDPKVNFFCVQLPRPCSVQSSTGKPSYRQMNKVFSIWMKVEKDPCICEGREQGTELWPLWARAALLCLFLSDLSAASAPPVSFPNFFNSLSSTVSNACLLTCVGPASMAALMRRVACSNVRRWGKGPLARAQMARGFASRAPPVLVDEFK